MGVSGTFPDEGMSAPEPILVTMGAALAALLARSPYERVVQIPVVMLPGTPSSTRP